MKIIAVDNNYSGIASEKMQGDPAWYLLTHSCLHRDNKPLYVPDWDSDFRLFPSMAVRIDRLGKSIPERFADRYWDSWSFGFAMRGMDTLRSLRSEGLPLGGACAFDTGAVIAPEWVKKEEVSPEDLLFEITDSEKVLARWDYASLRLKTSALIAFLSQRMTFKTGDLLYLGFPDEGIALPRDMKIFVNMRFKAENDTIFREFSGFNIRTYPQKRH